MSAPLAGKFQDHYAVLGVDPKANSETIQQAYSKLAQKYYPNNPTTGDPKLFDEINQAYEVLSDPQQRILFDKVKGVGQDEGSPKFTGPGFFDALGREGIMRAAILCILYDRRINKPAAPSLSMRHLELIIDATEVQLNSSLWYLKQRGLVMSDDKSSLQVTADGMDFLETNPPLAEDIMPLIKPAAIAFPQRQTESVLTSLNRVLVES